MAQDMCMEKITSKNNTIIKDTKKLFTSSKARAEEKRFVLEGARLCFDVLNSVYEPENVFYTENIIKKYPSETNALITRCGGSYMITEEIAEKLSDTKSPQGIFLTVKMKNGENKIKNKAIALDNVQDPSNVGAIIRSAEALGIDSVIVYSGCDVYNPKAIRASMGSVIRMNTFKPDNLTQLI